MRLFIFLSLTIFLLPALAHAGLFTSHSSFRYRMTVTVETPEGLKTGSVVREAIRYWERSVLPEQGGNFYGVKGEAIVVDLGKRGVLFALLSAPRSRCDSAYAGEIAYHSFPLERRTPIGTKVTLRPDQYPMFVRFRTLRDPKTVEIIGKTAEQIIKFYPGNKVETFEVAFGSGVYLKEVAMERTDDPVTSGNSNYFPVLDSTPHFVCMNDLKR